MPTSLSRSNLLFRRHHSVIFANHMQCCNLSAANMVHAAIMDAKHALSNAQSRGNSMTMQHILKCVITVH